MNCSQARQLFDAYLDGELSNSLVTELSAHRVRCSACRRELALREVTGRVIQLDQEPTALSGDFTDRLLACVESRSNHWLQRARRTIYIGIPLAAAAVVALAFLGFFDRSTHSIVAGKRVVATPVVASPAERKAVEAILGHGELDREAVFGPGVSWLDEPVSSPMDPPAASAPNAPTDSTILQMLQLLENPPGGTPPSDDGTVPAAPARDSGVDDDELEDL